METQAREREAEVLDPRAPVAAMAKGRVLERGVTAGAPATRRRIFRGVTQLSSDKYKAEISEPGLTKRRCLGTFSDAQVAACAYDLAAKSLQGRRARTNFDYPPPYELINMVTTAPGRRGPVYPVVPPPAATPPAAPAPVRSEHSYKAPPREPAQFPVRPCLLDPRGLCAPARAPEPAAKITLVRTIPPKPFSIQAGVGASRRVSDTTDLFRPPIHIVEPPSSPETCFSSTTDAQPRASASSSWLTRMLSKSTQLMLKTPEIFTVPSTWSITPTPMPRTSNEGLTGDNFSVVPPLDVSEM